MAKCRLPRLTADRLYAAVIMALLGAYVLVMLMVGIGLIFRPSVAAVGR
jgi:hypothetical protein